MSSPIITIGTPSRTKISRKPGYDQATVTFQSDIALNNWEARATIQGVTPSHGVGLLVESGGNIAANTDATVYVDDEELTNGDREYTITIHGHGIDGYWSDDTYEGINLFDITSDVIGRFNVTISNGTVSYNTGTSNTQYSGIAVELYLNEVYQRTAYFVSSEGIKSTILNKDETFDKIAFTLSGDSGFGLITFNTSMMENGSSYVFSFNIESLSLNQAEVSDISLVKVV